MPSAKTSVDEKLGELKAEVKSAHKRLDGMNKRLDGINGLLLELGKETGRIAGALELKPATVFSVPKNGVSREADAEAALSPADREALVKGRTWLAMPSFLKDVRNVVVALFMILVTLVFGWQEYQRARAGKLDMKQFREAIRSELQVVGPPAPTPHQ